MPDPILTPDGLQFYVNADYGVYTENPVPQHPATEAGDPVGLLQNRGDSGLPLLQDDSALKPSLSSVNGQPSLFYDGSGQFMTAGAVGDYNFLHTSAGFTFFAAIKKAQADPGDTVMMFADTGGLNSANVGFCIYLENRSALSASNRLGIYIGRGVSEAFSRQSANGALSGTSPHLIVAQFNGSNTLSARVNGAAVSLPNIFGSGGTPSTANHAYPMMVGKYGGAFPYPFHGDIVFWAAAPGLVPLEKIEDIEAYWMPKLGIS